MNADSAIPKIVDAKGIQQILGISETTLVRLKKRGIIPYLKLGGTHRYDVEKIIRAIQVQENSKGGVLR